MFMIGIGRRHRISIADCFRNGVSCSSQSLVRWSSSIMMGEESESTSTSVAATTTPTALVDALLSRTEQLMLYGSSSSDTAKESQNNKEETLLQHQYHHTVAFSGGVDSSLVAYLLHSVAGNTNSSHHTATAMLGLSPAVSQEQVDAAHRMAHHIGIPLQTISTTEGSDPLYIANTGQACFACKTHLYTTIAAIQQSVLESSSSSAAAAAAATNTHRRIKYRMYNGTNADDLQDTTRSGLLAAANNQVLSPLSHTSKATVRAAAAAVGLPNAYTAAAPCLRSRLQWGVPATQAHLAAVERMERFVRQQLQIDFASSEQNVRVRVLAGQRICVQVDDTARLEELYMGQREEWDQFFLEQEGFRALEIRPFRSGSVAAFGKKVNIQRH